MRVLAPSVIYFGLRLSEGGLQPTDKKVKAIREALRPRPPCRTFRRRLALRSERCYNAYTSSHRLRLTNA